MLMDVLVPVFGSVCALGMVVFIVDNLFSYLSTRMRNRKR